MVEDVAESGSGVEVAVSATEHQWQMSVLCFVPDHNISSTLQMSLQL